MLSQKSEYCFKTCFDYNLPSNESSSNVILIRPFINARQKCAITCSLRPNEILLRKKEYLIDYSKNGKIEFSFLGKKIQMELSQVLSHVNQYLLKEPGKSLNYLKIQAIVEGEDLRFHTDIFVCNKKEMEPSADNKKSYEGICEKVSKVISWFTSKCSLTRTQETPKKMNHQALERSSDSAFKLLKKTE